MRQVAISLPSIAAQPHTQTAAQAEALALRAGQVVEARVVGAGAGGVTQLSIGGQIVDAALAVRLPPDTLIKLLVQGSGANIRLTVQPPPPPPPPPSTAASPQPQTQNVSVAAQPASSPAPANGPASAPAQALPGQAPPGAAQTIASNARPVLVNARVSGAPAPNPAPPSQAGTPGPQQLPAATQTSQPARLEAGTVLRVLFQGAGAAARPILLPIANAKSADVAAPAAAQLGAPAAGALQQAVGASAQQAVVRQDSIATLLTNLAGLGAKLADLPKPVAQRGGEVLSARLNLDTKPLDGTGLRQALARSGVLFENNLLRSGGLPPPRGDIKSALLGLRNELRLWLGGEVRAKAPTGQPPPPTPGALPRAGQPATLALPAALSNAEAGARLLGQTEAALARLQLTQISSLPDAAMRAAQAPAGSAQELNIELPMLFGGELSVGQFQILKDGRKGAGRKNEAGWKMRFSINFSHTGEVGATVSLRGGKTAVMLWAEREETAEALADSQAELEQALEARGLEPGVIRCRHGVPPQAQKPVGAFMDDCS